MKTQGKKPTVDARKERLAKQLRANLQRRKEQARERRPEQGDDAGEVRPDAPDGPRRDT